MIRREYYRILLIYFVNTVTAIAIVGDYIQAISVLSQGQFTAGPDATSMSAAAGHSEPEQPSPESAVPATEVEAADPSSSGRGDTCASGVAVTNYARGGSFGWMDRPERNLLFVIHPWCMLRKSDTDRQSEFPPPGFLERLKAKLLALHRETDELRRSQSPAAAAAAAKRRRNNNNQRIKCWFQYTAAVAALQGAGSRAKAIATGSGTVSGGSGAAGRGAGAGYRAEQAAVVDFVAVRRRYAAAAAMAVDRGVNDC